jgi:hypothetical protein
MIAPAGVNNGPNATFTCGSGPPYTWTMRYTITGGGSPSFPSATNNGPYGFILQISIVL